MYQQGILDQFASIGWWEKQVHGQVVDPSASAWHMAQPSSRLAGAAKRRMRRGGACAGRSRHPGGSPMPSTRSPEPW